jgi:ribosomal protein S7
MESAGTLLIASIEEIIVRVSKRLVEHRIIIENQSPTARRAHQNELKKLRATLDRLVLFRESLVSERTPGVTTTIPAPSRAKRRASRALGNVRGERVRAHVS